MGLLPRRGGLTHNQQVFNYRLSRARRLLETADDIIKAACVLHNFLITKNASNGYQYLSSRLVDTEFRGVADHSRFSAQF